MSLPNPPSLSSQIPNQPFHSPETPATFDRLSGVLTPNIQLDPNPSEIGSFAKWIRPTDWLPLPAPAETEEKFRGLFAVYDIDTNFLAFTFEGDYVVNWGDGLTEYYSSGEKAQHSYQWSKVPFGTLTSEGFRQVIVTVTPQRGSHLTSMDLSTYHDDIGLNFAFYPNVPWMDVALNMPEADPGASIRFGTTDTVSMSVLQKVTIVHSGGATDFSYLVEYGCRNLGEFNLLNAPYVEDFTEVFYSCFNLKNVNIGDLPNVYWMDYLFQDCHSLEYVELSGLNSADSFGNMFYGCENLKSVKMSGLTYADNNLGGIIIPYVSCPNAKSLILEDLNSLTDVSNVFSGWGEDLKGFVKLTGLTNADLEYGFENCNSLERVELYDLENCTSSYRLFSSCESLKEAKLEGTQNFDTTAYMFSGCSSLVQAPFFDTSSVIDMYNMFEYCNSLRLVPLYETSSVEDMGAMFMQCHSLPTTPMLNTASVKYMSNMFESCLSLVTIPELDTSLVEDMGFAFRFCSSLLKLPALSTSACTSFSAIFDEYDNVLTAAPFQGTAYEISYSNCSLSRKAIVEIFNGLANASATVDVSYNYGAADLTAEDLAIAEGKGWTVTY